MASCHHKKEKKRDYDRVNEQRLRRSPSLETFFGLYLSKQVNTLDYGYEDGRFSFSAIL
jgi:hypothetical protein